MTVSLALIGMLVDAATARSLIDKGQLPAALREIERIVKTAPNDPDAQFEAGELLRQLGAARAERLRALAPNSPEAHELAGRTLEAQGDLAQALTEYRQAGSHFLTGNILWRMRDLDAAQAELETALADSPNHVLAHFRLGQVLAQKNQPREAIEHLRRAVAGDPTLLEAHRELGKALRSTGQYHEALQQLQMVAEQRPKDDSVHALLATVYRALGQGSLAAEQLRLHKRLLDERDAAARRAQ